MPDPTLCPSQQTAYELLKTALPIGNVFVVYGATGFGKTLLLQKAHQELGGARLTMEHYVEALRHQDPMAMEETLESVLRQALDANAVVIMDDLHLISDVMAGCGGFSMYPRKARQQHPNRPSWFDIMSNMGMAMGGEGDPDEE